MKIPVTILLIVFLSACSSNGRFPGQTPVIVDTKGVDMSQYQTDLADCEAYAQQVSVGEKAVVQGATGAVVGGAVGAIFDGSEGARHGAGAGAVVGTVKGASQGLREQDRVLKRCLRGRGYKVLS